MMVMMMLTLTRRTQALQISSPRRSSSPCIVIFITIITNIIIMLFITITSVLVVVGEILKHDSKYNSYFADAVNRELGTKRMILLFVKEDIILKIDIYEACSLLLSPSG